MVTNAHDSPEAAALAEWSKCPSAAPFIVRVEARTPDEVVVVRDTDPSHPMNNICRRTDEGWVVVADFS